MLLLLQFARTDATLCLTLQIARAAARAVCTHGSVLDARAVLIKFFETPEIRELIYLSSLNLVGDKRMKHWRILQSIVENINMYLTNILKTKGSRTTVAQRAYRTVLAACSGPNLKYIDNACKVLVSSY